MTGRKRCCKLIPMKTWVTYIAALLMGLATALLFGDSPSALSVMSTISSFMVNLGVCIAIPVTVLTFASGTASLGKDRKGRQAALACLLWALVTTVLLSITAIAVSMALKVQFPVTSTAGYPQGLLSGQIARSISNAAGSLIPMNAFWTIATTTYFIVPAIIVSWIFGLALRPSADIIRPAYTTMNSMSEVMYRISRTCAVYGFFLVYTASSASFIEIYQEKTLFAAPAFALLLAAAAAVAVLIIIPLSYAIFTGFKKNPYKALYRSLSPALAGLAAANSVALIPIEESTARHNLGVQKRISSISVPLLTIIGKGGSAFVATISMIALFQATTGTAPSLSVMLMAAGSAALISFISSTAIGTETALIVILALRLMGLNLYGAENAMIALLPLLGGIGIMIDSLIAVMGSSIASCFVDTDMEIPYKDTL